MMKDTIRMEVQGFGGNLTGKTIWVHQQSWVPWEFLHGITCRVLLQGSEPSLVGFVDPWHYTMTPKTAKDWSCIATVLKALSTSSGSVLVAWDSTLVVPPTFIRFVESLPVTRLMMSGAESPPLFPDALFFSADTADVKSICEHMPSRGGHGPYVAPAVESWNELVRTLGSSGMSLMLTDVGETAWTLFWYKREDSQVLTAAEAKERVKSLLHAANRVLELSP